MSIDVVFANFQSIILTVAALIGGLTTIGAALMWVYQKTIGKAKERRDAARDQILQDAIKQNNKPLLETLDKLNESMRERERHDDKLDEIAEKNVELLNKHDEQLYEHNGRLIVVETTLGIKRKGKKVNYVEQYGGDPNETH